MPKSTHKHLGRRERRKGETWRQIFQAASKLFERNGIFGTTVEEIRGAADVGQGTCFNYFASEEAILCALAERQFGVINRAVEKAENATTIRPILNKMWQELSSGSCRTQIVLGSLLGIVLSNKAVRDLLAWASKWRQRSSRRRHAWPADRGSAEGHSRHRDRPLPAARRLRDQFHRAVSQPSHSLAWQKRSMDLFCRGIATHSERILRLGSIEKVTVRHES